MRRFQFVEPQYLSSDTSKTQHVPAVITVNEHYIRLMYWPTWRKNMIKKFGFNHPMVTFNTCVNDFVANN